VDAESLSKRRLEGSRAGDSNPFQRIGSLRLARPPRQRLRSGHEAKGRQGGSIRLWPAGMRVARKAGSTQTQSAERV
jgi:hypothetical protein